MTNLYPNPNLGTEAPNSGAPGGAPVGSMQGNPQESQYAPAGVYPPQPINSAAILAATQLSNGQIPLHTQPNNATAAPGTDSLLAMLARGQVILKDSTYGIAQYCPGNGGAGPIPVPAVTQVAQPTGQASGVTISATPVYTGN
jgi:hypothetical protein